MSKYNLVFIIGEKIYDVADYLKDDLINNFENRRKEKKGYYDLSNQIKQKELTLQMNGASFPEDLRSQYTDEINQLMEKCLIIEKKCSFPRFLDVILNILVFIISYGLGFLVFGTIIWFIIKLLNIS